MNAARALRYFCLSLALSFGAGALAGEADVVDVKVRHSTTGAYDFDVTIKSVDKSWE
mgnify:CR=1 FL=1